MTKKITGAVLALLMALLMVPVMAFAEDGHRIEGDLNLANGGHEGKTLTENGYTWDATGNVLTIQDLTVTGTVTLPSQDCTICVKGVCSVEQLADSGTGSKVTVNGEDGATLNAAIRVSGTLVLNGLTMTDGSITTASVGHEKELFLNNSNITLHDLGWMTDDGIRLVNSKLHVKRTAENQNGQFWTEMIVMDEASEIVSEFPLKNYAHRALADFGDVLGYVTAPAGGYFARYKERQDAADTYNTIVVDKTVNGETVVEWAKSFTLKKTDAAQPEQPAEDDPVKEPENTHERPVRRFSNAPAAVEEAPKTVEAAKTGDMGVALYAVSAVLSAAGMAWVGKKRGR